MTSQTPEAESNPIADIQNVLSGLVSDGSLCAGFILVAEWIDEDGDPALSLLHSPMTPWHMTGLIEHARRWDELPIHAVGDCDCDDDEPEEG